MSTKCHPKQHNMKGLLEGVKEEYDNQVSLVDYFRKKCEESRKNDEINKLEEAIGYETQWLYQERSDEEEETERKEPEKWNCFC